MPYKRDPQELSLLPCEYTVKRQLFMNREANPPPHTPGMESDSALALDSEPPELHLFLSNPIPCIFVIAAGMD